MRKLLLLTALAATPAVASAQFINEFSYDCSAADDIGCEFVEIALPAGSTISDYAVFFYNGNGGSVYDPLSGSNDATGAANLPLTAFIPGATSNGYTLYTYTLSAPGGSGGRFQNGAPDGFALVNTTTNTVLSFLSYEGSTVATNGPANGMTGVNVGVSQNNGTAPTISIARTGGGAAEPGSFALVTATPGAVNTNQSFLPVELSAFTAAVDGQSAVLRWTTESETNNSGFSVEAMRGGAWAEVAFVAGRGTTSERAAYEQRVDGLPVGTHRFRLVQRDLDGTATVAGTVEVAILPESGLSVETRRGLVRVSVREAQAVTVEAFDVAGRRVAVLAEGTLDAGTREFAFGAGLAAGVYVVRASGAGASASATVVVR